MTLSLLTRGYVSTRRKDAAGVVFVGPRVTAKTQDVPQITGSKVTTPEGPSIVGAGTIQGPSGSGSSED
jgi:hypothetical protein